MTCHILFAPNSYLAFTISFRCHYGISFRSSCIVTTVFFPLSLSLFPLFFLWFGSICVCVLSVALLPINIQQSIMSTWKDVTWKEDNRQPSYYLSVHTYSFMYIIYINSLSDNKPLLQKLMFGISTKTYL